MEPKMMDRLDAALHLSGDEYLDLNQANYSACLKEENGRTTVIARYLLVRATADVITRLKHGAVLEVDAALRLITPEGVFLADYPMRLKSTGYFMSYRATENSGATRRIDSQSNSLYRDLDDRTVDGDFKRWTMRQSGEIRDLLVQITQREIGNYLEVEFVQDGN